MTSSKLAPAACLALLVLAAASSPTAAGEGRLDALETELARLRAEVAAMKADAGRATAERLDELERRLGLLAAEVEDLKVGERTVRAEASVEGLGPAASKVYRVGQGLSIGGYGEFLYERFDDDRDDGSPSERTDSFDALRAVVYFGYKFDDRFLLNTEIEVEHSTTGGNGEVSLEFAYLDWRYRPDHGARAGLLLVPMGFVNELHEPTTFLSAKRPASESVIIPTTWRENGFGVFGDAGDLSYRAYLVNGFDASGFSASGLRGGRQKGSKAKAEDLALVGRLDWTGVPGLQLGGSVYLGDSGQDLLAEDGSSLGVRTLIWEGHADWRWRGLQARGLYTRAELDDVAELNRSLGLTGGRSVGESLEGWYLEGGYDVLAGRGGRAALIPFARWEEVDTQASVPDGWTVNPANDQKIFTLGLAFKPIAQLILKLDWQDVDTAAGAGVDQLNVGLGYIF